MDLSIVTAFYRSAPHPEDFYARARGLYLSKIFTEVKLRPHTIIKQVFEEQPHVKKLGTDSEQSAPGEDRRA